MEGAQGMSPRMGGDPKGAPGRRPTSPVPRLRDAPWLHTEQRSTTTENALSTIEHFTTMIPFPSKTFPSSKIPFENIGFKFGETINDFLMEATLPKGWNKLDPLDIHSDIYDEYRRRRIEIDCEILWEKTNLSAILLTRYTIDKLRYAGKIIFCVIDRAQTKKNRILFITEAINSDTLYKTQEVPEAAYNWLATNFPEHANPTAYWSVP